MSIDFYLYLNLIRPHVALIKMYNSEIYVHYYVPGRMTSELILHDSHNSRILSYHQVAIEKLAICLLTMTFIYSQNRGHRIFGSLSRK